MRPRKKRADPLRRDDYVTYWSSEARGHAARFGWNPDRIPALVAALEEVFGAEWLRTCAARDSRYPITGDPKKHPVAHLMASPHRVSVMSLVELAVYLRSCRVIPRFNEVVNHLRSVDQFAAGRMQLALAHRFRRAGATDLEFEPPSDGGRKADLFFRFGGRNHLVECYEPSPGRNHHLDDLLHEGVERIFEVAKEAGRRVIVQVDLRGTASILDAALRKRIEQEAGHLIRSLKPPGLCEKKRLEGFSIEVLDTPDLAQAKAHALAYSMAKPGGWLIAPSVMCAGDVQKVSRGVPVPSMRLGWFSTRARVPFVLACDGLGLVPVPA